MLFDTESRLYYKQYDLEYDVRGNGDTVHKADRMKLDLFFDPFRRAAEQAVLVNCTKMLNLRSEVEGDAFSDQSRVLAVKMHATMEIVRQSGGFLYERGESRASVPQIGGLPYQTVQVDGPVRRRVGFPNKIGNQSGRRWRVFRDGRRHNLKKLQIYGSGGGDGGGLRPEAAVSQMHGNPAVI